MSHYKIADFFVNVDSDNEELTNRIKDFLVDQYSEEDNLNVVIRGSNFIDMPEGLKIADENIKWLKKTSGQDGYFLYTTELFRNNILCLVDTDTNWRNITITYQILQDMVDVDNAYAHMITGWTHALLGTAFRNFILNYDGVVIHASSLEWRGKGLIFSAPSGTGKSTHVKLWQECFGAEVRILNDDTPVVRFKEKKPYIFGTPWSGSKGIYTNSNAPLSAIVLLQQSSTNAITKISPKEAILKFMPRFFLPYFDENFLKLACDIIERILSSVPVYELHCKPDREAVELVYELVK